MRDSESVFAEVYALAKSFKMELHALSQHKDVDIQDVTASMLAIHLENFHDTVEFTMGEEKTPEDVLQAIQELILRSYEARRKSYSAQR